MIALVTRSPVIIRTEMQSLVHYTMSGPESLWGFELLTHPNNDYLSSLIMSNMHFF